MPKKSKRNQKSEAKNAKDLQQSFNLQDELIKSSKNSKKYNCLLLSIFIGGVCILTLILLNFPPMSPGDKNTLLQWPRKIEDLQQMAVILKGYSNQNKPIVYLAFCWLYIFLQTFGIPGPLVLSILAGTLFGGVLGYSTVCFCATVGPSMCYLLSMILAKNMILKCFPKVVKGFQQRIQSQNGNLFYYLLFLRITPICPNWVINISSPIVGVPYKYFFTATLFGLMPLNFIHIRTGILLYQMTTFGVDFKTVIMLFGLGGLALLPTLFKKKIASKIE